MKRNEIIKYIVENNKKLKPQDLEMLSINALMMIKVQIEVEKTKHLLITNN